MALIFEPKWTVELPVYPARAIDSSYAAMQEQFHSVQAIAVTDLIDQLHKSTAADQSQIELNLTLFN